MEITPSKFNVANVGEKLFADLEAAVIWFNAQLDLAANRYQGAKIRLQDLGGIERRVRFSCGETWVYSISLEKVFTYGSKK
jgi:hypothetical protein